MAFNINSFRSQFLSTGFSTTNFFELRFVKIPSTSASIFGVDGQLVGSGNAFPSISNLSFSSFKSAIGDFFSSDLTTEKLRFLCQTASIPGRTIASTSYKDYGNPYNVAQSQWSDTSLSMAIICPVGLKVNKFINDWQNLVVDQDTNDIGYYRDYVGEIQIIKYDSEAFKECIYTFHDVWPISVGQIDLNWADINNIARLPVTFAYRQWDAKFYDIPASTIRNIETGSGAILGGIGGVI